MVEHSDDSFRPADNQGARAQSSDARKGGAFARLVRSWRVARARRRSSRAAGLRFSIFSSLTRRILVLNLAGLLALVLGGP